LNHKVELKAQWGIVVATPVEAEGVLSSI
jgi:hypothetical protein